MDAFRLAAAADSEGELFPNAIHAKADEARFAALEALVARLREAGAPIHGVGLQGHFLAPPDGERLRARLERLAVLGVKVEISELDLPIRHFAAAPDPAAAQAEGFRTVLAACRAVPACAGVTFWGSAMAIAGIGPDARPLLFDEGYRPKPAYRAVRDAPCEARTPPRRPPGS